MTRHFTLPKILRMTPNILLREFFGRLDLQLISVDWKRLGEWQVEPICLAITWLYTATPWRT